MTSATTVSIFFPKASIGKESGPSTSSYPLTLPKILHTRGLRRNANMRTTSMLNSATFKSDGHEDSTNMIFSEQQYSVFERNLKQPSEQSIDKNFSSGNYLPNSAIFRQHNSVRAYEIGPTGKMSFEALVNLLQETGINSVKGMGLEVDRMGSTPEMRTMNLIWVATKVQVVIDRYPSCDNVVQVDSWIAMAGKNCIRRDAIIRDCKTGKILLSASSILTTMNAETRRVGRIPEKVRAEVGRYLRDVPPVVKGDIKELVRFEESRAGSICPRFKELCIHLCRQLINFCFANQQPRRSDLDLNQHVNSTKYIEWIFESVPRLLLEDHVLSCITMEYIKECHKSDVLKSLTTVTGSTGGGGYVDPIEIECYHLLKLESGLEIMRARSEWKPKQANNLFNVVSY